MQALLWLDSRSCSHIIPLKSDTIFMEASYNCDDILSGGYWVDFDTNTNTTLVQRLRLHPRIVHPGELLLQTLDLLTELVVVGRGDGQLGQLLPLLALLLVVDEPITKLGCAQYWRFVGEIVAGKNSQFRDNKKCVIAPLMRTHLKSIFGFWWEVQQLYQEAIFVQLLIFQCLSPNNRHHDS